MNSVLSLLIISITVACAINTPYTHHAILDNIQANTNSTAWGAAVVSFDRSTGSLQYTLVNNVNGTTAAHIHGPGWVLQSVGVVVLIPGFEAGSNHVATGTVTIPAANYDDIDNGRTYFNIHTTTWPNGEIRGQILAIGQQITSLNGEQNSVSTTAIGVAWTKFNPATNNLTLALNHNVQNPTMAHIHGPAAPGATAGPIVTIAANATAAAAVPIVMSVTLTAEQVSWLNAGLLYYNVHSTANPGGEVRGQINPIVNYLAELTGAQETPPQSTTARGAGFAALYGTALWSAIYHTAENVTASHIHSAPAGVAGPVAFPYANFAANPISENFTATQPQITLFVNGTNYFNVHNQTAPGGIIRGQIYQKLSTQAQTTTTGAGSSTTSKASSTTGGSSTTTTTSPSSSNSMRVVYSIAVVLISTFVLVA